MDLRKAACYRLKEDCGLDYEPTQIVVASGAKHSVYIALMTLCNPGDEVVIAAPYWVSYSEMVKQAGAIPVIVAATEEAHFKITAEQLDAAITDKTKVFMLNSPSNPTGMVYTKAELEAIAEVCCRHNIYVIADEIYCNLVYDNNEFVSFASLGEDVKERTILVNGVSKSYAMTGWRIGYSASNPQLAKVMANYLSHSTSAPSTISQQAAITALTGPQEDMQVMKQAFEQRRDHLVERMNQIEGVSCIKPEGAFYVMMNMKGFLGEIGVISYGDDEITIKRINDVQSEDWLKLVPLKPVSPAQTDRGHRPGKMPYYRYPARTDTRVLNIKITPTGCNR